MEPSDTPHEISLSEDEMSFINTKLMSICTIVPEPLHGSPSNVAAMDTEGVI